MYIYIYIYILSLFWGKRRRRPRQEMGRPPEGLGESLLLFTSQHSIVDLTGAGAAQPFRPRPIRCPRLRKLWTQPLDIRKIDNVCMYIYIYMYMYIYIYICNI